MKKVKKGTYIIKNWYIIKIDCKWYLLSKKEYMENKDNLKNFINNTIIKGFYTKKQLIEGYKNETFYKYIFEKN